MVSLDSVKAEGQYATVDLNAAGTTTIHGSDNDAQITGVYMENGGSTAVAQLESTNGTDTAVLAAPGAGNSLAFSDNLLVGNTDTLQINVTTAEGAALTGTVVVFTAE